MIPVCSPLLKGNEKRYVLDALNTNWISSSGKYINLFEKAFANFCGVKYGITTTSGTTALHLALVALGIKKGDEVIIPNFTMISCATAICYTGAKPVFVDVDKETWNIDPKEIEKKITKRTKAIMVVHMYGNPCDMKEIKKISKKYNLKIIEDSAESHGAEYKGKKCGTLGNIACFSFFANKIITTGEGGMVVTNNKKLAEKCRYFKNMCFKIKGKRDFIHNDVGFNYKLSNLHSAIGLAQTEKADDYVKRRIKNHNLYKQFLKDVEGITFQEDKPHTQNVYWMNAIVIDKKKFGMNRNKLIKTLKLKGIDTRLLFTGMNNQPSLKSYGCACNGKYPVTDWLTKNGLYLPSGSGLKILEIKYICDVIKDCHIINKE